MHRILVVCPNVSDVVLGCGGTLSKHLKDGDKVHIVILGDGITSRAASLDVGLQAIDLKQIEVEGRLSLSELGVNSVEFCRFPDNRFDQVHLLDIVKTIEKIKALYMPDIVYTTSECDLGVDQKITSLAVVTAFRPQPDDNHSTIYTFEVRSSTEWNFSRHGRVFAPNTFICVKDTLVDKLRAFKALTLEQRPNNHSRSIDAIRNHSLLRGCSVGLEAAEAFTLLRTVRKIS